MDTLIVRPLMKLRNKFILFLQTFPQEEKTVSFPLNTVPSSVRLRKKFQFAVEHEAGGPERARGVSEPARLDGKD